MKRIWQALLMAKGLPKPGQAKTAPEVCKELGCGIGRARLLLTEAIASGEVEMVKEPRKNALNGVVQHVPCYRWKRQP